jgi:ppGpp synthetase/RelA/SpoT-type nucleotidyltranferase
MSTKLTPELHKQQIEAYTAQYPDYVVYAEALKRILKAACDTSLPEAFVQARAKTIPSFAEKCARKFEKYPDAVNQFTDLCGARLIVQTIEQVEAAKAFVRANFDIVEEEDKASLLSTDKFGYRDMHFIIQLKAGQPFDLTPKELKTIGRRKAELQVRTWVQHAWADTLHDRIYKTPLRLSTEIKRAGNLLAAVMEEGDRGFDHLANELDGMLANYSAYASREDVRKEIAVLELLLQNGGPEECRRLALELARLIAPAKEDVQNKIADLKVLLQNGELDERSRAAGDLACLIAPDKKDVQKKIADLEMLLQNGGPDECLKVALKLARLISPDNEDVQEKIADLEVLLKNHRQGERPKLALKLAHLISAEGRWDDIITCLRQHATVLGPLGLELRSELGHALCRQNRTNPESPPYREGQGLLRNVVREAEEVDFSTVPNLRRARSVHARAYARLGWSYEPIEAEAHEARRCYARAVELEPDNPYYLADMLGFELHYARESGLLASFRSTIRTALDACVQHEDSGTELPAAHFTAGRLRLLLDEPYESLHAYARGIRYCLATEGCVPCDVFQTVIAWLHRVNPGKVLPEEYQWVKTLLELGVAQGDCRATAVKKSPTSLKSPVLLVVGGAVSMKPEQLPQVTAFLKEALGEFSGTVVSGGTTVGVPGCLGVVAEQLAASNSKHFRLLGYIPRSLPIDAKIDEHYENVICGDKEFSPAQVLRGWQDCLAAGVTPADVLVLGFGGGRIAAFEYRLALALGATVGVVCGTGGAADELLKDSLWSGVPGLRLYPLPPDAKTLRAFVVPDGCRFDPDVLEAMAQEFHARYRAGNLHKIKPDNLKLWKDLPPTYKDANREQAAYAVRILEVAGYSVREVQTAPVIFKSFTPEEIELMAELEHGRWNIERLHDGWRYGKTKDEDKRLNPCLVCWKDLPDGDTGVKKYDRQAVAAFPEILAKAGLEVYRPAKT